VRQRLFAIAQGCEDNNDAATLAQDPAMKIMAGRAPDSAGDLASQPTLSRFENGVTSRDLRRLSDWRLELYLKTHPCPGRSSFWTRTPTTIPPTASSNSVSSTAISKSTCITRSSSFVGRTGFPLAAVLRPVNTHASHRALAVLKRLIKKLKQAYLKALILFRTDVGFAVPALYR
jgi:hypothetical protein